MLVSTCKTCDSLCESSDVREGECATCRPDLFFAPPPWLRTADMGVAPANPVDDDRYYVPGQEQSRLHRPHIKPRIVYLHELPARSEQEHGLATSRLLQQSLRESAHQRFWEHAERCSYVLFYTWIACFWLLIAVSNLYWPG